MIEEKRGMRRSVLHIERHLPLLKRNRIGRNIIAHGRDILFDICEIEEISGHDAIACQDAFQPFSMICAGLYVPLIV